MSLIRIAVIDSGIFIKHPVFDNVNICDYSFGDVLSPINTKPNNGHGTAICGIIARSLPNAEIISVRLFEGDNHISELQLIKVLKYIYENLHVDIINLSLGLSVCERYHELYDICELINKNGTIIVSAFDNNGCISYPAAFDNVIGVVSGTKTRKNDDFEFVEDNVVNIKAKGGMQRVAWNNPDYIMMSGNSFACAYVTVQVAKYIIKEGTLAQSTILNRFRDISVNQYYIPNYIDNTEMSLEIKNAALFPFNKEMHSLVRYFDDLTFNIVEVYDIKYSGTVGASIRQLLKDNTVLDRKIKSIDKIEWEKFDTLILGHMNNLSVLIEENRLREKIVAAAIEHSKCVVSFDDLSYLGYSNQKIYYPKVDANNLPSDRFGMLYRISKPVVGVFGTSSKQGKFTLQLKLRKMFKNLGYNVGQIGTEPSSLLYGMDYCFPMGYNSSVYIKENDTIRYLNYIINTLCEKNDDIIIVGAQSGTVPYDTSNISFFTVPQYNFLMGTQPDCVVLCVNPYDDLSYVSRTINFIESSADCEVIAIVVFPMDIKDNWAGIYGAKKPLEESKYIIIKEKINDIFNIPVYKLGDDNDMSQLVKLIIDYFG